VDPFNYDEDLYIIYGMQTSLGDNNPAWYGSKDTAQVQLHVGIHMIYWVKFISISLTDAP
jgi:hypothetical protein